MCVFVVKKYTEEVFLPHVFCPIPVGSNINNPSSTFSALGTGEGAITRSSDCVTPLSLSIPEG